MIKLSRRLDYAILAVSHLASRGRIAPLSARSLADATRIPPAILANILKDLHRVGLVRSSRGVHGGYELAVAPDELSVGALLRALDNDVRLVECVPSPLGASSALAASTCHIEGSCPIKAPLRRVHERIQEVLDGLTFDQLVSELITAPLAR
ncbi:MAG: Rrf2 family transcriptional regulator [Planctomycetes bacterium]|nr:Rrf2 family transcriptional regulator [Planctomycetota bacterium]